MNQIERKPAGLTDEEWAAVQEMRDREAQMDRFADKIGQANDRYTRQRAWDQYNADKRAHEEANRRIMIWGTVVVFILIAIMFIGLSCSQSLAPH